MAQASRMEGSRVHLEAVQSMYGALGQGHVGADTLSCARHVYARQAPKSCALAPCPRDHLGYFGGVAS